MKNEEEVRELIKKLSAGIKFSRSLNAVLVCVRAVHETDWRWNAQLGQMVHWSCFRKSGEEFYATWEDTEEPTTLRICNSAGCVKTLTCKDITFIPQVLDVLRSFEVLTEEEEDFVRTMHKHGWMKS